MVTKFSFNLSRNENKMFLHGFISFASISTVKLNELQLKILIYFILFHLIRLNIFIWPQKVLWHRSVIGAWTIMNITFWFFNIQSVRLFYDTVFKTTFTFMNFYYQVPERYGFAKWKSAKYANFIHDKNGNIIIVILYLV